MLAHVCPKCAGPGVPEARSRVVDYILRHPDATQALMAEVLGLTRQTVAKHAHQAQRDGCLPPRDWTEGRGAPRKHPKVLPDWKPLPSWPIGAVPPPHMGHK